MPQLLDLVDAIGRPFLMPGMMGHPKHNKEEGEQARQFSAINGRSGAFVAAAVAVVVAIWSQKLLNP